MTNEINQPWGLALSDAVADAVERAAAVTVLINARRRRPMSGLLIASDMLLTASHGVERETDIEVLLPDGGMATASLAGRDRGADLAVLRLSEPTSLAPLAAGLSGLPRVGALVLAVGRPSSEGHEASFGMVTALGSGLRTRHGAVLEQYIAADAVPYPGFSGGPLADLAGGILGINTSGLVRGMSLAIPIQAALDAAESLVKHGRIRRGYLGIRSQTVDIPAQARAALGRDQSQGLLVIGVEAEGPASAANGLMVGDILVGLDGSPVVDHESLFAGLSGEAVSRPVQIQVLRGGQPVTVFVTPTERTD